jgi:hypothetical protein
VEDPTEEKHIGVLYWLRSVKVMGLKLDAVVKFSWNFGWSLLNSVR